MLVDHNNIGGGNALSARGEGWPGASFDRARRNLRTSSRANRLLTVDRAASFMAVALATISAWLLGWFCWKFAAIGVLTIEAQLPLEAA